MNTMTYRDYAARVEYDDEDKVLVGHLAGIRDIVGFHAESVAELEVAFHAAVDDYLSACERLGQSPEKPVSGKLLLRVPVEVHRAALRAAELSGQSLTQWAAEVLRQAAAVK